VLELAELLLVEGGAGYRGLVRLGLDDLILRQADAIALTRDRRVQEALLNIDCRQSTLAVLQVAVGGRLGQA
jgi:hypothetical protein